MAYQLRAFLGHLDVLQSVKQQLESAVIIPMEQDVGMIPVTNALHEMMGDSEPTQIWYPAVFRGLSESLVGCAVRASASGMIAYAEADYFAGEGYQATVIWRDEAEIMGPFLAYKFPLHDKPFNRTLRMLGVQIRDAIDEFDTLGLGACRHTEDWVNRLNGNRN